MLPRASACGPTVSIAISTTSSIFRTSSRRAWSARSPRLEQAEMERAKRKRTGDLDAYDYSLRGLENFYQRTREATGKRCACSIARSSAIPPLRPLTRWRRGAIRCGRQPARLSNLDATMPSSCRARGMRWWMSCTSSRPASGSSSVPSAQPEPRLRLVRQRLARRRNGHVRVGSMAEVFNRRCGISRRSHRSQS